ncbi:MAG: TatD family hydrolase [Bacillus subtilis]|nr:TatD family hydrolase [Bacillus subtilis]
MRKHPFLFPHGTACYNDTIPEVAPCIFDSHVHLNDDLLYTDLDNVVSAALEAGVGRMVCIGYDVEIERAGGGESAERYDTRLRRRSGSIRRTRHLMNDADFDAIERMLQHPKVVAVGEMRPRPLLGQDQARSPDRSLHSADRACGQIPASRFVVHMREATMRNNRRFDRAQAADDEGRHALLRRLAARSAADFIRLGMFISLAGPVTFKNARVREAGRERRTARPPADRDRRPCLAPDPHRGQRNESIHTCRWWRPRSPASRASPWKRSNAGRRKTPRFCSGSIFRTKNVYIEKGL